MQKKLIALAVAGLVSAPAFAQSNVTIYGVADAGIGVGDHGSNDFQGVLSGVLSGSRIGFKGSEDLGNGLKAVFQLEQGFDIGNGEEHRDDRTFSRQSWVGLSGGFGTVGLGYQYAPGYFANYDAVMAAIISPQSTLTNGLGMTITPNSPARWDNSVTYTGKFEGLTVRANYSMQAQENTFFFGTDPITGETIEIDAQDDDAAGLGIDYSNGPLSVGAVVHWLKGPDAVDSVLAGGPVEGDDTQEYLVGGSFNFGFMTLAGSWQQAKNLGRVDGADADVYQIGVIVPVGAAGNIHLAYGEADVDFSASNGEEFDGKSQAYTVAYTHALSKRTTAYVGYAGTSNDDGLFFGAANAVTPGIDETGDFEDGDDSNLFTVGLRHTF